MTLEKNYTLQNFLQNKKHDAGASKSEQLILQEMTLIEYCVANSTVDL